MCLLQMSVERLPFSHLIIRLEPITLNIEEMKKKMMSDKNNNKMKNMTEVKEESFHPSIFRLNRQSRIFSMAKIGKTI